MVTTISGVEQKKLMQIYDMQAVREDFGRRYVHGMENKRKPVCSKYFLKMIVRARFVPVNPYK